MTKQHGHCEISLKLEVVRMNKEVGLSESHVTQSMQFGALPQVVKICLGQ